MHFSVLDLFLVTLKVPRKSGKKRGEKLPPYFPNLGQSQVPVRVSDYAFFDLFSVDWQL